MKKGRLVFIDDLDGQDCAALVVDGQLQDLLVDPVNNTRPRPEAIYRAKVLRPMNGQNGVTVDLGGGLTGFLKQARGLSPGQKLLVQVATHADPGKAPPVTRKLMFKSRYAIVTPGAPGLNVARKIRDDDERNRLLELAHKTLEGADQSLGLILRSASVGVAADVISQDISETRGLAESILADTSAETPQLLMAAPAAHNLAWRDWAEPDPNEVVKQKGAMELSGVRDLIDQICKPVVPLASSASMIVEPTSALVAIDVNTGGDFSLSAGLKANLATAADLPRQLRLRGLGGQIVVDFAPMPRKDRRQLEQALARAFRADSVDTALVGWTPLGHFELQRKRERIPLTEALAR